MRTIFLDLSKRSAGYACWGPGDPRCVSGAWILGSEFTSDGLVYCKLHENLSDLHALGRIEAIFWEEPLDARVLSGHTNIDSLRVLNGLAAHAASWGEAMGCRIVKAVNMTVWRRFFIGAMPRATKSADLKLMSMQRCRQLGFKPATHDEAEAIGGLSYACDQLNLSPPWRDAHLFGGRTVREGRL
ncbi:MULTISPECIES: hypothetical protein [unclassified Sphingomonas]|uniref:hypothetical protein n=1 Tax=unclassified Sphingomonas TaxID=196159 RepID=UPI0006F9792A|nr:MULTISPECIES: hypothetical protein [unclassified Sphingomonas]KQX18397.1 hypothetical protein ASD17_14645 [Sphingomonas sp. Root1294]KQY72278.1 hypothetical protein ASD39_20330 [Sphingomonas sp. Root50]KRB94451.1 hypothetical protein ASE22_00420 [Sphingomonas sp. Root720]